MKFKDIEKGGLFRFDHRPVPYASVRPFSELCEKISPRRYQYKDAEDPYTYEVGTINVKVVPGEGAKKTIN